MATPNPPQGKPQQPAQPPSVPKAQAAPSGASPVPKIAAKPTEAIQFSNDPITAGPRPPKRGK
jgi:hypothetical protein